MNAHPTLTVFADLPLTPSAAELLRAGLAGHRLIESRAAAAHVLAKAGADPAFAGADITFGQPDPDAVAAAPRLRWMHIASSGITRYDTPEFRALLQRRGIVFTHSPRVYAEPCADHVLAFLLAQSRGLPRALASRAAPGSAEWLGLRADCVPLRGATLLILGFGAIGRALVERLRPFQMRILAYRRSASGDEGVPVTPPGELDAALAAADHVVNILPDRAETRGFFDARRLAAIKPGAVFYNIGRGTTVDQDALCAALRAGRLRAAWLDVTDPEPLPDDHPLRAAPNCYITPHIAGGHAGEMESLARHFLDNFDRFLRGAEMLDRVV